MEQGTPELVFETEGTAVLLVLDVRWLSGRGWGACRLIHAFTQLDTSLDVLVLINLGLA